MTCVRKKLVAHVNGELPALEAQLVDAHLAHCASCRAVHDELARGLSAARREIPVDAEMLVALMREVPNWPGDVVAVRRKRARIAVASIASVASVASLAAGLVIAFAHRPAPDIAPSSPALVASTFVTTTSTPTIAPTIAPTMAPPIGPPIGATTKAVPLELEPVATPRPIEHATAAHLKRVDAVRVRGASTEPSSTSPLAHVPVEHASVAGEAPAEATLEELLPQLDECERLGRAGDGDEARARYKALEENPRFAAHADLVAYNRARLEGLVLGDADASLAELSRLAREAHGHVAAEAALTRCEVERGLDACAALACLDNIAGDAAVDAQRLRDRWRSSCEQR